MQSYNPARQPIPSGVLDTHTVICSHQKSQVKGCASCDCGARLRSHRAVFVNFRISGCQRKKLDWVKRYGNESAVFKAGYWFLSAAVCFTGNINSPMCPFGRLPHWTTLPEGSGVQTSGDVRTKRRSKHTSCFPSYTTRRSVLPHNIMSTWCQAFYFMTLLDWV